MKFCESFLCIVVLALSVADVPAAPFVSLQGSTLSVPASKVADTLLLESTNLIGLDRVITDVLAETIQGGRGRLSNLPQWVRRYNGGLAGVHYSACSMVPRNDGSVVIAGTGLAALCYATDGTPLWTNRIDGGTVELLGADAGGNVWAAGNLRRYATNYYLTDFVVMKYASNGIPLWTNRSSNLETNSLSVTDLLVDQDGNAYVKYYLSHWGSSNMGLVAGQVIVKYEPAGNIVWTKRYPGTAPISEDPLDWVVPIALDNAGNLFAAGGAHRVYPNSKEAIVKFSGDGTALWTNLYPSALIADIDLLSVDHLGSSILAGSSWSTNGTIYAALKFATNGLGLWTNTLSGPTYNGGNVPLVALDALGNTFVIGGSPDRPPGFYQILKLGAAGLPLWTNQSVGFGTNSMIQGASVDSAGNLYLSHSAAKPGRDDSDYVIVKYSSAGWPMWTNRFDGDVCGDDYPYALAVDRAGSVYVTGTSKNISGADATTLKYTDMLFYTPPADFIGMDTIRCVVTDGFGNTATGRVSVLVEPGNFRFNVSSNSLKLAPGGLKLVVDGLPSTNAAIIEASTNLRDWSPILTNTPLSGSVQVLDSKATNLPKRFYRVLQAQ